MKNKVYDILKGKFLINDDAIKTWVFILVCTVLGIIMIAFSHSAEHKVNRISDLQKKNRKLRSKFVNERKQLMELKMKSHLTKQLEETGVSASKTSPEKIIIAN